MKEAGIKYGSFQPLSCFIYRLEGREYEMLGKGRLRILLELLDEAEVKTAKLISSVITQVAASMKPDGMSRAFIKPEP